MPQLSFKQELLAQQSVFKKDILAAITNLSFQQPPPTQPSTILCLPTQLTNPRPSTMIHSPSTPTFAYNQSYEHNRHQPTYTNSFSSYTSQICPFANSIYSPIPPKPPDQNSSYSRSAYKQFQPCVPRTHQPIEMHQQVPRTLSISIYNHCYQISEEVLHKLFDPYGVVDVIHIVPSSNHIILQYQSSSSALAAQHYLHGHYIYANCCQMHIQFLAVEWERIVELLIKPSDKEYFSAPSNLENRCTTGVSLDMKIDNNSVFSEMAEQQLYTPKVINKTLESEITDYPLAGTASEDANKALVQPPNVGCKAVGVSTEVTQTGEENEVVASFSEETKAGDGSKAAFRLYVVWIIYL